MQDQQRFRELSALFNKNDAICQIIKLEKQIAELKSNRVPFEVMLKVAENTKVPIKVYENYNHIKTIALNGFRIYGLEPQLNSKEIVSGTVRVNDILTALKKEIQMEDLLIVSYKADKEGVTLEFNKKVSLNGGISCKEIWVSWDKIGQALFPDKYSNITDVAELRKMRAAKSS